MTSKQRRQLRRLNSSGSAPAAQAGPSQNATTHGLSSQTTTLLPHEDHEAFAGLHARYIAELKPATEHHRFLVRLMASAQWRLIRINQVEAAALEILLEVSTAETSALHTIAARMGEPSLVPDKLLRHRNAAERSYHKAYNELMRSRKLQNELYAAKTNEFINDYCALPENQEEIAKSAAGVLQNKPNGSANHNAHRARS